MRDLAQTVRIRDIDDAKPMRVPGHRNLGPTHGLVGLMQAGMKFLRFASVEGAASKLETAAGLFRSVMSTIHR